MEKLTLRNSIKNIIIFQSSTSYKTSKSNTNMENWIEKTRQGRCSMREYQYNDGGETENYKKGENKEMIYDSIYRYARLIEYIIIYLNM